MPVLTLDISAFTDVNIQPAVTIYIGNTYTGGPYVLGSYTGQFGNIEKREIALVEIQLVVYLITTEEQIGQAIFVKITNAHSGSIVEISESINVDFIGINQVILKRNMRDVRRNCLK